MAAVVGGMAFFLPNGLGAHDGITVSLLATVIGVPIPVAAAGPTTTVRSSPSGVLVAGNVVTVQEAPQHFDPTACPAGATKR